MENPDVKAFGASLRAGMEMTVDEALGKVTATFKIGRNKSKGNAPRIWLDGQRLDKVGFVGGTHYFYDVWEGMIVCALEAKNVGAPGDDAPRTRKVTGRKEGGKPIIDISGGDVTAAFGPNLPERVKVTFEHGKITIVAAPVEAAK